MDNIKSIVFTKKDTAEFLSETIDPPKGKQVRVKLAVSTVSSGTERANISGSPTISPHSNSTEVIFPRRGGYSSSGVVTAVGEEVKNFAAGDRVAVRWSVHSSEINIDESNLTPLPDEVSFENAAVFNIATFPLAAIRKCRIEIGESALVMGMGVLGLCALPLLKAAGAVPIIAADPVAEKREKALSCGADYALDPLAPDFAETVKSLTGGGAHIAIEVTGVGAGLTGALDCMRRFGRVALLGCTRVSDFTVDYYRKVHGPGITLIGAHTDARPGFESRPGFWTAADDMLAVAALTKFGRLNLASFIDETHSPEDAPQIYKRLVSGGSFPFIQFDWRKLS